MGKKRGYLEWRRETPAKRELAERVGDWAELELALEQEAFRAQGARCMDCGIPFCHQGCPLGNLIPDFNDLVYRGQWRAAWERLSDTNDFPEFTGRICPAPCEGACTLAINDDPVAIESLEKEIAERAFAERWVQPRPPRQRTGRRVAVVGSGPAGLAAAARLNAVGHTVTVFERSDRIGGLLRYGIPDFKLDKRVIDRRLALMEAEGVAFRTSVSVGDAVTWSDLRTNYDAVLLAIGARRPRDLDIPGRELSGVHLALDYLEQQNRVVAGDQVAAEERIDAAGRHVVVLGGGDTGSDCLGTALRQGAASVTQIELMPRPPEGRAGDNPWPEWPLVFRTSTSQEEGGDRRWALLTKELLPGADGRVARLRAVGADFERVDGRRRLVEAPDREITLEADLVVLALGFVGPDTETLSAQLGVALGPRGNVQVSPQLETSVPGVYAAGDAARGASLVVWAISEGREAARAIDTALRGEVSRIPTRGEDRSWSFRGSR